MDQLVAIYYTNKRNMVWLYNINIATRWKQLPYIPKQQLASWEKNSTFTLNYLTNKAVTDIK